MTAEPERIQTREELHAVMRRLHDAQSRIEEIRATFRADHARVDLEHERIEDWYRRETADDMRLVALLRSQAEGYLRANVDKLRGKKSIATPWGTVASRAREPEYRKDDAALVPWAKVNGYLREKVSVSVDWDGIKAGCHVRGDHLVTADGEIVDGVEVIERQPNVWVEPE